MLNKHILSRYNSEVSGNRSSSPYSPKSPKPDHQLPRLDIQPHSARSTGSGDYLREISLSARGRLRKERSGLCVQELLKAEDRSQSARRKKRNKTQNNLFGLSDLGSGMGQ